MTNKEVLSSKGMATRARIRLLFSVYTGVQSGVRHCQRCMEGNPRHTYVCVDGVGDVQPDAGRDRSPDKCVFSEACSGK
jgi:hypothetical protein